MVGRIVITALVLCLTTGCVQTKPKLPEMIHVEAPFQRFVAPNFEWSQIRRIVVMPFANQMSAGFPKIGDELQAGLAAEMQRAGRFEVVVATRIDPAVRAQDLFQTGQFDELEVLRIAREYQADAVLFANVTQYQPYVPPRIGLSLMLIFPAEGTVIASASGLWDAREATTAAQAQAYFKRTQNFPRSLMGAERVTESPNVFQRFVCQQIAVSMTPTMNNCAIPSGAMLPPEGAAPQDSMMPHESGVPQSGMPPNSNGLQSIPPIPPPGMNIQ